MKRFKRHKVKEEKPEASTSHSRTVDEYDLTYYIHDRVELMHQVFSVLRHKDLKAMAPECVRHISVDDLQELCTEELLGISSKRLCAILDGAEPPSDTESSSESPERFETISLDSISSDEEILSETSSKKSKKHKRHRRDSKGKSKKKKNKETVEEENPADADLSRASRAGLTVLELLELQARARAIRAQLQQEQAAKQAAERATAPGPHSSDNEVEIKEEPAEVVEISSDDEKPKIEELGAKAIAKEPEKPTATTDMQTVTKRIKDYIVTVPQAQKSRKIKLNRTRVASVANNESNENDVAKVPKTTKEISKTLNTTQSKITEVKEKEIKTKESQPKEKVLKTKEKKKKKKKVSKTQDSDHDEITLQLSDTEKMDLLEDLDRKNFEKLSSSDSEDSETSSSDSDSQESDEASARSSLVQLSKKVDNLNIGKDLKVSDKIINVSDKGNDSKDVVIDKNDDLDQSGMDVEITVIKSNEIKMQSPDEKSQDECVMIGYGSAQTQKNDDDTKSVNSGISKKLGGESSNTNDDDIEITSISDIPIIEDESIGESISVVVETETIQKCPKPDTNDKSNSPETKMNQERDCPSADTQISYISSINDAQDISITISVENSLTFSDLTEHIEEQTVQIKNIDNSQGTREAGIKHNEKDLSDGELSDRESSEVEAVELKPEVVCISDDETSKKSQKKKKKKEKKNKSKKSKKSKQDFQKEGDQNFYKETEQNERTDPDGMENIGEVIKVEEVSISIEDDDYDDVYEILELSNDSSCYEVEGTVLSKEPTAKEIEALSAKIDEIEREDVVTEEEIREHERRNVENTENIEELENISWKDRYLESNKVKKVLSTSNIFNALRKKNRELKKKLEESKKKEEAVQEEKEEIIEKKEVPIEEGSITQYNTLEGLTKFVDPVPEVIEKTDAENGVDSQNGETTNGEVLKSGESELTVKTPAVGKEIRKDAKQLLKMYKRLLKYNDMNKQKNPNKQKDPNKKKKKKSKKIKIMFV